MKKRVCPKCGNEIEDGEKFCSNCGTPIPEKKKKNFKIVGIAIVCVLIVFAGIGMLDGGNVNDDEFNDINNIKASKLVEIVSDEKKADKYIDKNIRTKGYLFRKDDQLKSDNKLNDAKFAISTSTKSFMKDQYILLRSEELGKLKNVGSLSKITVKVH